MAMLLTMIMSAVPSGVFAAVDYAESALNTGENNVTGTDTLIISNDHTVVNKWLPEGETPFEYHLNANLPGIAGKLASDKVIKIFNLEKNGIKANQYGTGKPASAIPDEFLNYGGVTKEPVLLEHSFLFAGEGNAEITISSGLYKDKNKSDYFNAFWLYVKSDGSVQIIDPTNASNAYTKKNVFSNSDKWHNLAIYVPGNYAENDGNINYWFDVYIDGVKVVKNEGDAHSMVMTTATYCIRHFRSYPTKHYDAFYFDNFRMAPVAADDLDVSSHVKPTYSSDEYSIRDSVIEVEVMPDEEITVGEVLENINVEENVNIRIYADTDTEFSTPLTEDAVIASGYNVVFASVADGIERAYNYATLELAVGGSSDASIAKIFVDGVEVKGVSADVEEYNVVIPAKRTEASLSVIATDGAATVDCPDTIKVGEPAEIYITSENQVVTKKYIVNAVNDFVISDIDGTSAGITVDTVARKVIDAAKYHLTSKENEVAYPSELAANGSEARAKVLELMKQNTAELGYEDAYLGASFYISNPSSTANGTISYYTWNNGCISSPATAPGLFERGYTIKTSKGLDLKPDNFGPLKYNPEMITFNTNAPGTMYVLDMTGYGYPGGEAVGYKKSEYSVDAFEKPAYEKHFDAGKVVVPGLNNVDAVVGPKWEDADGDGEYDSGEFTKTAPANRLYDTLGLVFVFDDVSVAELGALSYTLDGETVDAVISGDEITFLMERVNGTAKLEGVALEGGSVEPVEVELVDGAATAEVVVTSFDKTNTKTYNVIFRGKSNDATLSSIKYSAGGATAIDVSDLSPEKLSYTVEVPSGTFDVELSVTPTDKNATVEITKPDFATDRKAVIEVTAEDGTEVSYEITFEYSVPMVSVSLSAVNGNILAEINKEAAVDLGASKVDTYLRGTTMKLTAVSLDEEKYEFLYWKDSQTGQIVSYNEVFEFSVGTPKSYMAQFVDKTAGKAFIVFRSNGKVLASGYSGALTAVPNDPYIAGYDFKGWYLANNQKVETPSLEADVDTTYYAGFALSSTEYEITVDGVAEKHRYNEKVTVSADAEKEGQVFTYWTKDGEIVSYSREYSFYVNSAATLVSNYADAAVAKKAIVTIAEPVKMKEEGKIAFYAERDIPAEYKLIETGILINSTSGFDVNTADYRAVAANKANKGQYTVRKANVQPAETWYAMAYAIYLDENGEMVTAYSDEVFETMSIVTFSKTYPNYSQKAITFSYDDLVAYDVELIEIFDKYGLKGTFNIVTNRVTKSLEEYDADFVNEINERYKNHEVANHSDSHPRMYVNDSSEVEGGYTPLTYEECKAEFLTAQEKIKLITGAYGRGGAWPYSPTTKRDFHSDLIDYLQEIGFEYMRPTGTKKDFDFPEDWMNWKPNCHHEKMDEFIEEFKNLDTENSLKVFYVWGHAYELPETYLPEEVDRVRFDDMDAMCAEFADRDAYWAATNIEVCEYAKAMELVEVDYDKCTVSNPSDIDLHFIVNEKKVMIPAGVTMKF